MYAVSTGRVPLLYKKAAIYFDLYTDNYLSII